MISEWHDIITTAQYAMRGDIEKLQEDNKDLRKEIELIKEKIDFLAMLLGSQYRPKTTT